MMAENLEKETQQHIYFALDSDILRTLAYFCKDGIGVNLQEKCKEPMIEKHKGYFFRLMNLVENDQIRFLITNTVYQENKHSDYLISFITKYMYAPDINFLNSVKYSTDCRLLAYEYCKPYTDKNGIEHESPMKLTYNAESGTDAPTNDAFIVAEASLCGVPLLTFNGKHIIYDERDGDYKYRRADGIAEINRQSGCVMCDAYRNFVGVKPVLFFNIAPRLKDVNEGTSGLIFETDNFIKLPEQAGD